MVQEAHIGGNQSRAREMKGHVDSGCPAVPKNIDFFKGLFCVTVSDFPSHQGGRLQLVVF